VTDGNSFIIAVTDENSLIIACLIVIGILAIHELIKPCPKGDKPPKPKINQPASIKPQIAKEFNELSDMLNIILQSEHHRLLDITRSHVEDILEKYEKALNAAVDKYSKDIENWKSS
jgi:hypothetical protein